MEEVRQGKQGAFFVFVQLCISLPHWLIVIRHKDMRNGKYSGIYEALHIFQYKW